MDQSNPVLDKNGFVFDVLKRLPAKSLIRFMCVSKSWCHLISKDPSFTYLHLQFQKSSKDLNALLFLPNRHLFLPCGQLRSRVRQATLEYLSLETSEHKKMKSPWKRPWIQNEKQTCNQNKGFFIAGHCNGLVCVSDAHKLIIWNPGIRRFKILPDSDDFNHQLQLVDEYLLQRRKVHLQIAAFGGSQLALFVGDHRHKLLLTVWVMEEDQVSWSKLFRINLRAEPLCFSKNGEVFFKTLYAKLLLFDPKLEDPCCSQDLGFNVHHDVDYVERLLFLDEERGEEEDPNHEKAEETRRLIEEAEEEEKYLKDLDLFD